MHRDDGLRQPGRCCESVERLLQGQGRDRLCGCDGNGTINTDFPVDGLTVRFTNFEEDAVIETLTDENGIAQTEVAPGNYTISVFGESESEGNTYYLNGSVQNKAITKDITPEQAEASNDFSIAIRPAMVGPLCFSQIFYCGSTNPETQATYFRDQTYEIYNNGDEDLLPRPPLLRAVSVPEFRRRLYAPGMARIGGRTGQLRLRRHALAAPGQRNRLPARARGESVIIAQEAREPQPTTANPADSIDNFAGRMRDVGRRTTRSGTIPDVPDLAVRILGEATS